MTATDTIRKNYEIQAALRCHLCEQLFTYKELCFHPTPHRCPKAPQNTFTVLFSLCSSRGNVVTHSRDFTIRPITKVAQ